MAEVAPAIVVADQEVQGRESLHAITQSYDTLFSSHGYQPIQSVEITDKVDASVRFIGAPISVMKPYLGDTELPPIGVHMVQPCVRTQNVAELFDPASKPEYGSYFVGMGALTNPARLVEMFQETTDYMTRVMGLDSEEAFISTSSEDKDLTEAAEANGVFEVKPDVMSPDYYRHTYGMDGVWGRNTSYWVKNRKTGEYEDIGNVISIESVVGSLGVELALGDSTLYKQIGGLDHVLDVYNLGIADRTTPSHLRHKLEDSVLTSMVLWREGLAPGTRNNQSRILRSYFKGVSLYRRLGGISLDTLEQRITAIEEDHLPFDALGAGQAIVDWVNRYESRLRTQGATSNEDSKVIDALRTSPVQ